MMDDVTVFFLPAMVCPCKGILLTTPRLLEWILCTFLVFSANPRVVIASRLRSKGKYNLWEVK